MEDIRSLLLSPSSNWIEEEERFPDEDGGFPFDRMDSSVASLEIEPTLAVPDEDENDDIVEQDPHAVGLGGSLPSAVLGIIKGMVGPAILYLPHGFASAGYLVALPIMAITTALFLHSSKCLLDSWKIESNKQEAEFSPLPIDAAVANVEDNDEVLPLQELEESSPQPQQQRAKLHSSTKLSYPELAQRAFGKRGEQLVELGIALMQSGVCLTYLIFVPHNLHTSLKLLLGWDVAPEWWLIVMVLIQIPLSWIRDIRKFTVTNLVANGLIGYGLATCLGFAVREATTPTANTDGDAVLGPISNLWNHMIHLKPFASQWFLFIGTSVLLFEGSITLLVPLQEAVKTEADRAQFPAVYKRVILGIISFYVVFGITCWMSFGNDVSVVLTTSLPPGLFATTVQLAYSVAVIFTFPLQNFPSLEILCRSLAKNLGPRCGRSRLWTNRDFLASLLVCLLAVVAVATMNSLDKVVSLFGSLFGCPIAFVAPPLIHNQLCDTASHSRRRLNYAVAGLGFVAMILASAATILKWRG